MPATSCASRPGAGGGRGGSASGAEAGGGSWATTGGDEGVLGVGAGGEAACCPASGAGLRAGGAVGAGACAGVGAGGAAASGAAGGEGEDGAEGAAFCAVEAGDGTGATGVVPRETGGRTLVWSIQKTAAIATRTTPASKARNQRDMAFPPRRSELLPATLEVDQSMLMDMRYVNERRHFCCHVVHKV